MNNRQNARILIVDDDPQNLQVLGNMLQESGYYLAFAKNGVDALDYLHNKQPPNLILLDIMLPDIDGFEICKQLKQSPILADIPVIFLSAKTEKKNVIEGLELGAVDYITKPFTTKELIIRVKTHLELKAIKDITLLQREKLNQTIKELKQANAAKDKFFSIISHDLKNIFNVLTGLSGLLVNKNLETSVKENFIKEIQTASEKGYHLLKNLLEWSRSQIGAMEFKPTPLNLQNVVSENIEFSRYNTKDTPITILSTIPATTTVFADKNMLNTIFRNLLSNAIKFTPANGKIEISSQEKEKDIEISISDTGIGIKAEDIPKLFNMNIEHTTVGINGEEGTGLGLLLCQELIKKNGGSIRVESEEGKGSRFYINFPLYHSI